MALELTNCYAKESRDLQYMCKGSENCLQTITSIEDKVTYDVSLQEHSELCLMMSKISDPDPRFIVGIKRYLHHIEREYQTHLTVELALNNAKYIATDLKINFKSDQQTERMREVLTELIHDERCCNVSEAISQNVNFKEDKGSKENQTYTETNDFKNDHEFGSEFFIFYGLLVTGITILNMRDTLSRAAAIVLRTWRFAVIIEIVIRLLAIIIESVTLLFTMTGLNFCLIWVVRVFTITQIILFYTVANRREGRARRAFVLQHPLANGQPEAFNNNPRP